MRFARPYDSIRHVHGAGAEQICRESYNQPRAVHDALKRRGMDLITITGHDSVDAAEEFRGCPDFFVSEEISCTTPCGSRIHVGVYD